MFDFAFDSPWYLLLLALPPLLWVFSFRTLSGLGPYRRIFALGLRTLILVLIVLSLAEMQRERTSEKLSVIYLLDQSLSIPAEQRQAMLNYVDEDVRQHRNADRGDLAGVIAFGREAAIEIPPFDDDLPTLGRIESLAELQQDATNLTAALKLAQASFPEDSAKRIVIVSDGNENIGDARQVAANLASRGISIYVVPVMLSRGAEVAVEKVMIPTDVRKGQPFDVRVVVNNLTQPTIDDAGHVQGTLKLSRRMGQHVETVEQEVELAPGKKVFKLKQQIVQPDFYTYEARFVPDDPSQDRTSENNRASAFTHVRGQGHVLLIEDWENKGEFTFLVDRLKTMNLEVTVASSDQLFTSLGELQRFDTVVLANVPRSSGNDAGSLTHFSDAQIDMLVRNVQQMGSGLVMIGGPNSYGAGGWANTELEKAMPVDFQIHNAKVVPMGALVMMMHASEMAQGNHWQKVIAREALKALGPQDYCGVVQFDWDANDKWLWNHPNGLIKVGGNRNSMLARLDRMTPGDMPQFEPSMKMAVAAFGTVPNAGVRHMIIISDGDPSPPSSATIQALKRMKVKVTTVAVGTHGPPGSTPLQRIATQTGGKYYVVTNPRALPRIFQREARRVARPLIKEKVVQPQITSRHEILRGIHSDPPPIKGFVLTSLKQNPLVEVLMVSPDPPGRKNATILAGWTYGLGRTAVLTTDAGKRWADQWTQWEYDKFFSQLVSWSMRPMVEEGKFTVATEAKEGKVRVVVTALDKDDEFLNFLSIRGSAVDPSMKSLDVPIQQTAPGRYIGEFEANESGSYFVTINVPNPTADETGDRRPVTIRSGVNVPYSSEFRDRQTNLVLLDTLARLQPQGGQSGKLIDGSLGVAGPKRLLEVDTFRHDLSKAVSSRDIWPLLMLIASCLFLADVFIRRVSVHFYWILPLLSAARDRALRKQPLGVDQRIQRLKSRKELISAQLDERRAAARFEPQRDVDVRPDAVGDGPAGPTPPREPGRDAPAAGLSPAADQEEETYTERLLKAKKNVWKDQDRK